MDKSQKLVYFAILSLVFVVWYVATGSETAVNDTMQSVVLVALASLLTWAVMREFKKRGSIK